MKKFKSPVNGREYWYNTLDDLSFGPAHEGLPVFSSKEIKEMCGKKFLPNELNVIFDAKLELGATVESVPPYQELGYCAHEKLSQADLAKKYTAKITAELRERGARTAEEKKLAKAEESQQTLPLNVPETK